MKKFLILGIGNAQVDLIRYLKENTEFKVYGASYNSIGRGLDLVDEFIEIDITNKEKILDYMKKENIDYIYSVGSDVAMPTVSWVSEQLGLPHFVSYEIAITCNTKNLIREKLDNSYGNIPYKVLNKTTNLDDVIIDLPAILKPVDSQGQRGVQTINNLTEIKNALEKALTFSRKKEAILEKKVVGEEISVNVFVKDSELIFFLPSGRISWKEFDGGIIHKHILPLTVNASTLSNIKKLVKITLEKMNITNGPAYFQIMLQEEDAYLIEVTPRLDGCHMWHLIKESTGVDLLDLTVKLLLNHEIKIPEFYSVKPAILEFICQPPNEIFSGYEKKADSIYYEPYYKDGEIVNKMNGFIEKCGYEITVDK